MKAEGIAGHGHALCECQWVGPHHRLTGAQRKRDHAAHKMAVRERLAA